MANVGFKVGLQSKINKMMTDPQTYASDITEGSFYLTSDSHRLYIGAYPPIASGEDVGKPDTAGQLQLFPLNEGITTVPTINDLPTFNKGTAEYYAAIGDFYYVENNNILCIFGGDIGGYNSSAASGGWIQINQNTDTSILKDGTGFTVSSSTANNGVIQYSIATSTGEIIDRSFSLKVDNGLTASFDQVNGIISISGDSYTLGVENADEKEKDFNITLTSSNTDNDTKVKVEAGSNITLTKPSDGVLRISAAQLGISGLNIYNGQFAESADKEGFRIVITDTDGQTISSNEDDGFNPEIRYGMGETKSKAYFKDGIANLAIYTAKEIETILRELNAMHYVGTIGTGGSACQEIIKTGNNVYAVRGDGSFLDLHIGDMFICLDNAQAFDTQQNKSRSMHAGTFIIINSSDGSEDTTTGIIDPTKVTTEIIDSTLNSDTTYTLQRAADGNGIALVPDSNQSVEFGAFRVEGGTAITVSENYDDSSAYSIKEVLTVNHGTVARTDTTEDVSSAHSQTPGEFFDIPLITAINTNEQGHVTGIKVSTYRVADTVAKVSKVTNTSSAYKTSQGTNVGVVNVSVTTAEYVNNTAQQETTAQDNFTLVSDTLKIESDSSHSASAGGTANEYGLSINMVWGEF